MIAGWRLYAALGLVAAMVAIAAGVGLRWAALERAAASSRAAAAAATARAETAEATAARNAAAIRQQQERHAREMDELTALATEAADAARNLATVMETLRADPSFAAPAADVLDRALDRLRDRRAASGGDPPGADPDPGAAADPARPAGPAAAGHPPDPGSHR